MEMEVEGQTGILSYLLFWLEYPRDAENKICVIMEYATLFLWFKHSKK